MNVFIVIRSCPRRDEAHEREREKTYQTWHEKKLRIYNTRNQWNVCALPWKDLFPDVSFGWMKRKKRDKNFVKINITHNPIFLWASPYVLCNINCTPASIALASLYTGEHLYAVCTSDRYRLSIEIITGWLETLFKTEDRHFYLCFYPNTKYMHKQYENGSCLNTVYDWTCSGRCPWCWIVFVGALRITFG